MKEGIAVLVSLLTAVGGWTAIKYMINRNTERRKAEVEARESELELLRKQYNWLNEKYDAVSRKLDDLYVKFRALEDEKLELIRRNGELELALKMAEYDVCKRPDEECLRRIPERERCRLRKLLGGMYDENKEGGEDNENNGVSEKLG